MAWLVAKYLLTAAIVVPTLPMFLAFPVLLPRLGFWATLLACIVITVVCFGLFAYLVRRFGIELL